MSDDKYRLQGGAANHYHDGEPVGDEPFVPTDSERELLGDLLVPAHDDQDDDTDAASTDGDESDGAGSEIAGAEEFIDDNAQPTAGAIEAGDADGHLAEVREAENEGKSRSTVHDALDDRAEETGEDAGERADGA